jgi:hypothetical protein
MTTIESMRRLACAFLAFPVYGTAVWLFFVLSQEAGDLSTAVLAGWC